MGRHCLSEGSISQTQRHGLRCRATYQDKDDGIVQKDLDICSVAEQRLATKFKQAFDMVVLAD